MYYHNPNWEEEEIARELILENHKKCIAALAKAAKEVIPHFRELNKAFSSFGSIASKISMVADLPQGAYAYYGNEAFSLVDVSMVSNPMPGCELRKADMTISELMIDDM